MASSSNSTVVGIFTNHQTAQKAVADLKAFGFSDAHIGVLGRHTEDNNGQAVSEPAAKAGAGAATGAAAGAGLGALWGLAILAGVLPGIGTAIAGGTLGVLLSSAAAGAAAIGVAGALAGMGLSQEDATYYESEFKSGRTLVTVKAGAKAAEARRVIAQHGGTTRQPETVSV